MSAQVRRAGSDLARLLAQAADPAAAAAELQLYVKDVSGVTQLFARASDGTVYQVTPPASPTVINELWGPPITAHPASDEFDTNAVGAQWLQTGFSGNLNFGTRPEPYTAPAVNAASWENLRDPDNTTDPTQNSWLRMQPGQGFAGLWQPLDSALFGGAVPTNLLTWFRARFGWRNATGISAGDYDCGVSLFEDVGGGINFARHATFALCNTGQGAAGAIKPLFSANPGSGEIVVSEGGAENDGSNQALAMFSGYGAIQKIGDDIHAWLINDGGNVWFGADSNAGYGSLNAVGLWCNTISGSAANGGIPIFDFDFIRFYEGIWLP